MTDDAAPRLLEALHRVLAGESLEESLAQAAMAEIMAGSASEGRIAGYLVALRLKGETAAEVIGSARAMRAAATGIDPARRPLLDTCGTGGDASGTFNISTGSALVAAAAGATVAKHGNRSVSSRCGSADVLHALGIPIDLDPDTARDQVERHGFGFLMAPRFHGAIRHAMPARLSLATRTLFNLLGPLCNPASAERQVLGVFSEGVLDLAADAIRGLGTEHAFVVHSEDGLDEISLSAPTWVVEVSPAVRRRFTVTPEEFGFARVERDSLAGGDAEDNARILTNLFAGEPGPRRDVVVMNAAMALVAAGVAADLRQGRARAEAAIDEGLVRALVTALRERAA
ncbi:MAG: anthranilate phosphoribosyltransferase [bacterium]